MDAYALLETLGIGTTLVLVLVGWRVAAALQFAELGEEATDPTPIGS